MERALARIRDANRIDAAVLDVNLNGGTAFPIADVLAVKNIPFIFASGHGDDAVAVRYPAHPLQQTAEHARAADLAPKGHTQLIARIPTC